MLRTEDEWIRRYSENGALWIHDGNALRPHALLTAGNHSNGFFNSERVMEEPLLLEEACVDLVHKLGLAGADLGTVDRVVGPAMGAITLAHDLARSIGRRGRPCLRAYTEKLEQGGMAFSRTKINKGERILCAEDVVTTGSSIGLTAGAAIGNGGVVLPYVAVLVNRSGLKEVDGRQIIALIDRAMPMWEPEECELCAKGSEAIRPKIKGNWERLNATY